MNKTEPLPKWMMKRYALMLAAFKEKPFTIDECADAIKEDKKMLLVLLSRLRLMGWITTELDKDDARKRLYTLRPIEEVLELMTK